LSSGGETPLKNSWIECSGEVKAEGSSRRAGDKTDLEASAVSLRVI
jgi:hypothetical protein